MLQSFKFSILFLSFCSPFFLSGQNVKLGAWTAQIPLQNATSVCQSNNNVYASCLNGVVSVNIDNNFIEKYTKVDGLAEVFTSQVGYDTATSTLVIAYKNSNIDLIQNGEIVNLPYLKNALISGDKNVYSIFCFNGKAYMGTGFGVLEIDLINKEVSDTYIFNDGLNAIRVNAIYANEESIYCATTKGVLMGKIAPNVNLLDFNNWIQYSNGIPQNEANSISIYQNKIIASVGDIVYQYDGNIWASFFTEANWKTVHLNSAFQKLQIVQEKVVANSVVDRRIGKWNGTGFLFYTTASNVQIPQQVMVDKNDDLWCADLLRGLIRQEGGTFNAKIPNGPFSLNAKEMDFLNGSMWVSSSAIRNGWNPDGLPESKYFYKCTDYYWDNYNQYNYSFLDTFNQIAVVKALPTENKILFGAAGFSDGGIIEFSPTDNTFKSIKYAPNNTISFRITGADRDEQGNVWFSNAYSPVPIICRKQNGEYVFFNSGFISGMLAKDIVVDDFNQIWIAKEDNGGGLVILNYGNDIDDKSDDQYFNLAAGSGNGDLPSNNIICLAKDADGTIWLGTSQGIAVITCAGYVTDYACEAQRICIDRNDGSGFCDNLLEDESINCITVDAANRKWIGTNNGLFLISADGLETIHFFNETNSPLLANNIRSVAIHPDNGDVFISTEKGICTYRADATFTTDATPSPFVYPNPVHPDYDGPIAIKGIPNNCNVKIVDVSGNLVYETTSLGGQAIWDGKLINGNRAATGVYYALCKGSGKKETAKIKFVLIH